MTAFELAFQLFSLLLGLAMAELLAGLARSWRISKGVARARSIKIRIGWLVPLFGLLLLFDLTRFWLTAYALRDHFTFDYASLLATTVIIGGYYAISTFVFPPEPADWPDFDDYFLRTNRTVVGGMIVVNFTIVAKAAVLAAGGVPIEEVLYVKNWISLTAYVIYLPSLIALWLAKSKRANLLLLLFVNALLLLGALGSMLLRGVHSSTLAVP